MSEVTSTVFIVDDDAEMRESLVYLLQSVGIRTRTYSSASSFLEDYHPGEPGCLVCDVRMPDLSGLDLVERLIAAGIHLPVIFMTAYADVPMAVRALKSGASEFIEKPFNAQAMLERIQRAVTEDRARRAASAQWHELSQLLELLTDKERDALAMILEGIPNKNMAHRLEISERAVEMRRSSIMRKLRVHSTAELIRLVTQYECRTQPDR